MRTRIGIVLACVSAGALAAGLAGFMAGRASVGAARPVTPPPSTAGPVDGAERPGVELVAWGVLSDARIGVDGGRRDLREFTNDPWYPDDECGLLHKPRRRGGCMVLGAGKDSFRAAPIVDVDEILTRLGSSPAWAERGDDHIQWYD